MKLTIFLISLFFSFNAIAGVPLGVYTGTTDEGKACAIEVIEIFFENNHRHPLNERLKVLYNGQIWNVRHSPSIDAENTMVRFDHNEFSNIIATNNGAKALIITIDHSKEPHGPETFDWIYDNYQQADKSHKISCKNLILQ